MSTSSRSPQQAPFSFNGSLHTPPVDAGSFSPTSTSSVHSASHKVAPAMRDEASKGSPRLFTLPQWGIKESPRLAGTHFESPDGMTRSVSMGGRDAGAGGYPARLLNGQGHSRNQSSPQVYATNRFAPSSPDRLPPRPESPTYVDAPVSTLAPAIPPPSEVTATGAPIFNKVDFSFGQTQPLDLGITLDSAHSTYKETRTSPTLSSKAARASEPTPTSTIASPVRPEDEPGTPYAAQVRVSVAQRVERAPSFRKGSLAELNIERPNSGPLFDSRRTSNATTASGASSMKRALSNDLSVPQLRPPRAPSPGGTTRPIGQGMRSSYAGSTASSSNPAPVVFRRASSVYVPNNSSIGMTAPLLSAPIGAGPGGQLITPGAKLPLNLLSLARRTAHISDVPGYAWRLNLLEKLEVIMGSFLTIQDAEAILSIGSSAPEKRSNRIESRKSQIGMPTPSSENLQQAAKSKQRAPARDSFFGRMKRVLSNPHAGYTKETPPPLPTSRKAVFGAPLSQVAEYGFVTSMIAGQRHDLPGVVFSTVEEIYRRGQGTKVPGLMQLQGEPGRVQKLVQIYDTAPDYGEHHDLSIESIHNVTSLLKRYLRDLPEPVLDQRLWRLFLVACVDSTNSPKARIACAQIILRLLPTANFSLLVYMVAFLSQMPLFPENRLTLEQVSGLFGSSIMSPRPKSQSKKPAKGEMVITGPTETVESVGEAVKKGQDALTWLLGHWSSVADGLLEPDFDIDPATIVDTPSPTPAPTLNVEVPQAELHIQQPQQVSSARPDLPAPSQPREAPAPPLAALPWSAQQQHKAFSPVIEQSTAEISPIPRFEDVAYHSGPPSPAVGRSPSLALRGATDYSPRINRHTAPSSSHSHGSPAVSQREQEATPRTAQGFASPSLYGDGDESGPPTPSKEFQAEFAPPVPPVPEAHARPMLRQGEDEREQVEVLEKDEEDEEAHATPQAALATRHSPNGSTSDAQRSSSTRSSQSTASEHGSEVRTPPSSTHTRDHSLGNVVAVKTLSDVAPTAEQGDYVPVVERRDIGVLDELLDYDASSVYAFPEPPVVAPIPTRPSPFLPPSPFLSQEEIAAALTAEHERELAHLPAPVNPADYAHYTAAPQVLLDDKIVTPATGPAVERGQDAAARRASVYDEEEEEEEEQPTLHEEKALVPLPTNERALVPVITEEKAVVPTAHAPDDEDEEEEEDAPPPVPLKSGALAPRALSVINGTAPPPVSTTPQPPPPPASLVRASAPPAVNLADFAPRVVLPSTAAPGAAPPALLRTTDEQLRSAQEQAEQQRKELQGLWAQLTELELERTAERAEMVDLRQEVESFKARMSKRLSRSLNDGERRKLETAEERAREAERAQDELRRTREDLELLRQDAVHAKEEANRFRDELKHVEELRRKEQADARSQIEALEAQLSSIRAVLLGGAGIKI
ncbi:Type II inositol 1,4,5-trisphosphate 5-phosphatase [Rhodotorula kratochvilovae]